MTTILGILSIFGFAILWYLIGLCAMLVIDVGSKVSELKEDQYPAKKVIRLRDINESFVYGMASFGPLLAVCTLIGLIVWVVYGVLKKAHLGNLKLYTYRPDCK